MIPVLVVDLCLEVPDVCHDAFPRPPPYQVIEACHQENPHGTRFTVVFRIPTKIKITDFPTWHSDPVHVTTVWRAGNAGIPGAVKGVKLGVTQTDIQTVV